jgi:murein L,D-transpeptidase YcbB/YkuD
MRAFFFSAFMLSLSLSFVPPAQATAPVETVGEIIRRMVEDVRLHRNVQVNQAWIASHSVLPELYENRGFRPVWTDSFAVDQLLDAVAGSEEHGLRPVDYHFEELKALQAEIEQSPGPNPERSAAFDLLLTDSLVRLSYHLIFGKEDPVTHHPQWNLNKKIGGLDPAEMLQSLVESCSVRPLMEDCMPRHPFYARMKRALAKYRAIAANGGWKPVAPGPTLDRGMTGPRVLSLRRRLAATGDLPAETAASEAFDEQLEEAVIRFQTRHRLQTDGRVGKNTLEALNEPVSGRIATIRVALERLRWVVRGVPKTYVVADIAHFDAAYYVDNRRIWHSRTQVGTPYRETPVFRADMTYLVFNPTWTIPPTILAKDILPAVKKNRDYLKAKNIRVLDHEGNTVDADAISWEQVSGGSFPYLLRQDPGPSNALGRIKFMFPNPYHVYMHDPPSKTLFERVNRAFSSGCIRIENPLELAELLLDDPVAWNREKIEEIIAGGETRTVSLKKRVPVLLLYSTAWVDDDGTVYFTRDIYGRDEAVLKGLDSAFRVENSDESRPAL